MYETDTFPHLDLFRIESIGHSVQAEAFDLDTGERVWDTMLSSAYPVPDAEVLAMGSEYVYVRSSDGLVILDAATGAVISRDDEIAGIDENYIASLDAYAWDASAEEVVMLDVNGRVHSIPLDTLNASPASIPVAARWRDVLNTEDRFPGEVYSPDLSTEGAGSGVDDGRGHIVTLSRTDEGQGLLVVASADGIRSSKIGERGFLGW